MKTIAVIGLLCMLVGPAYAGDPGLTPTPTPTPTPLPTPTPDPDPVPIPTPLPPPAPMPTPAPSTTPAPAPAPAAQKVSGTVKSIDTVKKEMVVTVAGKDMTYTLGDLKLDPSIKVGSTVEVSYEGSAAKVVTLKK